MHSIRILIVILIGLHGVLAHAGVPLASLVGELEERWSQVRDFQAQYRHMEWNEQFMEERHFAGEIRSVSPGRLRIDYVPVDAEALSAGEPQATTDETGDVVEVTYDEESGQWVDPTIGDAPGGATRTVVFDGRLWRDYDPTTHRLSIGETPPNACESLVPLLAVSGAFALDREAFDEQFVIKPVEEETVDSVPCYRVEIWERGPHRYSRATISVWIEQASLLPARLVTRVPGVSYTEVDVQNVRLNTGLKEYELRLMVPAGVQVFRR